MGCVVFCFFSFFILLAILFLINSPRVLMFTSPIAGKTVGMLQNSYSCPKIFGLFILLNRM